MTTADTLRARLLKGFSVVLIGDLIGRGLAYFLLPVYLHMMDKAQVGSFTYILAIVQLISQLSLMGLYAAQSKLMGECAAKGEEKALIGGVLVASLVPVVAVALFFALFPRALGLLISDGEALSAASAIIPLGIVSGALTLLYANLLMAIGEYKRAVIVSLVRAVLGNAAAMYVLAGGTPDQSGARLACVWGVDALVFIAMLVHYSSRIDFGPWRSVPWRRLAVISLPVWMSGVIGLPLAGMDRVVLEHSVTKVELADYNVAMSIAGVLGIVFASFNSIWFPLVLAEPDMGAVLRRTRRMALIVPLALAAVGLGVACATWSGFLLGVLPQNYSTVMVLLVPMLLGQICNALAHLLSIVFYAMERTWLLLWVNIPVSLIFLLACLLVIPAAGTWGAALLQVVPGALISLGSLAAIMICRPGGARNA